MESRRIGSISFLGPALKPFCAMGIYDRDYMREKYPDHWWKPGYSIKRWLTIGVIAVSFLTSLFYFARTTGIIDSNRRPCARGRPSDSC